jgi:hypothetical protein
MGGDLAVPRSHQAYAMRRNEKNFERGAIHAVWVIIGNRVSGAILWNKRIIYN